MKPIVRLPTCVIFLVVLFIGSVHMETTFKMTNFICESKNQTWITIDVCRLRAINRYKTTLTIEYFLHFPVQSISVVWQMRKKANGYKPWLGQYTVDVCAFFRRVNHPVIKILFDLIKDFSTINHTCPYVGKQWVKDFFWQPINFSVPIPSGEYMLHLTWLFSKKPQILTIIYFTFKQDLLKD